MQIFESIYSIHGYIPFYLRNVTFSTPNTIYIIVHISTNISARHTITKKLLFYFYLKYHFILFQLMVNGRKSKKNHRNQLNACINYQHFKIEIIVDVLKIEKQKIWIYTFVHFNFPVYEKGVK